MQKIYIDQVKLLLKVLPEFQFHHCLALKGGTAINLFVRDLPRLSIDLDFSYVPIADRKSSLEDINTVSYEVMAELERKIANVHIGLRKTAEGFVYQMLVQQNLAAIKIDINHIIRGTVFPCRYMELSREFSFFCEANVVSFEDLYAGKICAALDRQHPRDFFDIKFLLDNDGLSEKMMTAFVVYLIATIGRFMSCWDLIFTHLQKVFEREFRGMAFIEVSYGDLVNTADQLLKDS